MVCKQGETSKGMVTVPLQRGENNEETTCRLLEQAKQAVQRGAETEIIRLADPDYHSHVAKMENISLRRCQ